MSAQVTAPRDDAVVELPARTTTGAPAIRSESRWAALTGFLSSPPLSATIATIAAAATTTTAPIAMIRFRLPPRAGAGGS